MSRKDYSGPLATARRLVKKNGAASKIVYTTIAGGNGTPTNPGVETEVAVDCEAARDDYSERERDGTSIQIGDRRFLVAVPATLRLGDVTDLDNNEVAFASIKLRFPATGGRDYQVMSGKIEGPSGEDVLYVIRART